MSPDAYQQLLGIPGLIDHVATLDATDVTAVASLRKRFNLQPHEAAAVLDLAQARRKAASKFPDDANTLLATSEAIEQATSLAVAKHKALRFPDNATTLDLCCGIGGDALGFKALGKPIRLIDHDPLRLWMASQNTGYDTQCADVAELDLTGQTAHIDPGRRNAQGRIFKLQGHLPGPEVLRRIVQQAQGLAIKLGPGVNADDLPWPGELEYISERGRLVQAVSWTGALQQHPCSATCITPHAIASIHGEPATPPHGPWTPWLHTVDPAAERAELLHVLAEQHSLTSPHPALGILCGRAPVESPWLTAFQVHAEMPWRPAKVKAWLRDQDAGLIEVKTRGKACDPDRVQADLRGPGQTPYVVFVLREDQQITARIAQRVPLNPTSP